MKISVSQDGLEKVSSDVLAICVATDKVAKDALVQRIDAAMNGALLNAAKLDGFKGAKNTQLALPGSGTLKAKRIVLLGVGKEELTVGRVREFAVRAGRIAQDKASLTVVAPSETVSHVEALADGITTGAYRYARFLTGERVPKKQLEKAAIVVLGKVSQAMRDAVEHGVITGEAANLARDLVNCPPNVLNATELGKECQKASRAAGVQCKVLDKKAIEKLGMPLLLAVNKGSKEEPRFIHMTYKPAAGAKKNPKKVVFVGKGLTFDAGGLCIKPPGSMVDMKCDMAGSAVTLATVIAAARLKLPVEVHAIIGSTDNMTGGDAYRPGDVWPSRNGMSVEIINTDAEGRLVLADCLAYATELNPDIIIDHATLTGACMVALGPFRAALFANDDKLGQAYKKAAEEAGEDFWPLPLDPDLREQLQSSIADIKHTGGRLGGTITAALFLKEFVGKCKWAHLDIAGPSFLEGPHGIYPKGGTGFGVLTAVSYLRNL